MTLKIRLTMQEACSQPAALRLHGVRDHFTMMALGVKQRVLIQISIIDLCRQIRYQYVESSLERRGYQKSLQRCGLWIGQL